MYITHPVGSLSFKNWIIDFLSLCLVLFLVFEVPVHQKWASDPCRDREYVVWLCCRWRIWLLTCFIFVMQIHWEVCRGTWWRSGIWYGWGGLCVAEYYQWATCGCWSVWCACRYIWITDGSSGEGVILSGSILLQNLVSYILLKH